MNILAIGAHWDDIELGCGLTLKALKDKGHNIFSSVICVFIRIEIFHKLLFSSELLLFHQNCNFS